MAATSLHQNEPVGGTGRIHSIQALRAVAACMVVFAHLGFVLKTAGPPLFDGEPLEIGVDIFFVISGYIMLTLAERSGSGPAAAARFLVRRAARLLPLYWVLTTLVAAGLVVGGHPPPFHQVMSSYLLIPDIHDGRYMGRPLLAVGWTLIYEFYFYALIATAIACGVGARRGLLFVAAVLAGGWGLDRMTDGVSPLLSHYGQPMVFEFALGGALALATPYLRTQRLLRRMAPLGIIAAPVIVARCSHGIAHGSLAWTAASLLVCLSAVLAEHVFTTRWLRPIVWLGDVSYSTYLGHFYFVTVLGAVLLPLPPVQEALIYLPTAMIVAIGQAALLFYWVERPCNRGLVRSFIAEPGGVRGTCSPDARKRLTAIAVGATAGLAVALCWGAPAQEWWADWRDGGRSLRLVAYGTSLTRRYDWTPALARAAKTCGLSLRTWNAAQDGAASSWGVASLEDRVIVRRPQIVLLEFAMNDAYRPYALSLEASAANTGLLIDRLREKLPGVRILLMTTNPVWGKAVSDRPDLAEYYRQYAEIARHKKVQLVDQFALWGQLAAGDPDRFHDLVPDGVHPTLQGHLSVTIPALAEALAPACKLSRDGVAN